MSHLYGKVFGSLYEGSMIGAGVHVFALWPYCLARCDQRGYVEVNPKLAAVVLGCSVTDIESALEYLQRPDPESRSQEEEGRRLVRVGQFAYRVVNYLRYREIRDAEARREYQREWVKEKRANRQESTGVDGRQPSTKSTKGEGEGDGEGEVKKERGADAPRTPPRAPRFRPPSEAEWILYSGRLWPDWQEYDVRAAWAHYQGRGWRGITDWRAAAKTCRHRAEGKGSPKAPPPGVFVGAHPPREAPRRNGAEPEWVRRVYDAMGDALRPDVPDELVNAAAAWRQGDDVPEPERWEEALEEALEKARECDRRVPVPARALFLRR